jgi:16S rRNA (uracil1498-N3)-methyltransferase
MRRFFVEHKNSQCSTLSITGSDAKHIQKVLGLKKGDTIGLFDGKGFEYEAKIVGFSAGNVNVSVIREFSSNTESPLKITVAQGFLKEKKMDTLLRQLTELGITRWIPFYAERSIARPDKNRLRARVERWKKIAMEALKQCGRGWVTEIVEPCSFQDMLAAGQSSDLKIVFWENEQTPIEAKLNDAGAVIHEAFVVIGPEGGLSDPEIEQARKQGFVTAAMGPRILRAETATIAACSLVQYLFGDMG